MLIAYWALELIPQSPYYQYHQIAVTEAKLKTLAERLHNQGFPFAPVYKTKRIQNRNLVEPPGSGTGGSSGNDISKQIKEI
jgi:hypothetical protein